jgi:large subunit ribosomal protein L4
MSEEVAVATLKKFNLEGKEVGSVEIDSRLVESSTHSQLIKDYIVALRANARQWSANTKGRSEVSHSTKKPHPQKGGGRARQGSLAAPQYKGGGRVFGPKPKFDQHVKINQKQKRAAIRSLIAEKIRDNRLIVIDSTEMQSPKTKRVHSFLANHSLDRRVLFLGEGTYLEVTVDEILHRFNVPSNIHDNFIKSVRNIPDVNFKQLKNISGYDVVVAQDIVITEPALEELHQWLLTDERGQE